MLIATWNVNSIRVRLDQVLFWLDEHSPDVLCLQETKVTDKDFPYIAFEDVGYEVHHYGQKSYNGVAIASQEPLDNIVRGFDDGGGGDGDEEDPQTRLIAASLGEVTIIGAYFPNGQSVESDKYKYKLAWMDRLHHYLDSRHKPTDKLVLCGDFNVAPEDKDVWDPERWQGDVLVSGPERDALAKLRSWGLEDTFRLHHNDSGLYSWWDYRQMGHHKNQGLRIDHIYATEAMAAACTDSRIDKEPRFSDQPSDHAPVLSEFDL